MSIITHRYAVVALIAILSPFMGNHAALADAPLQVYISAPADVTSSFSNITTSTFDSQATGNYSSLAVSGFGTYQTTGSNKFAVVADNQYGSGTGNYFAIGAQSGTSGPVTLTFNSPQSYFGFAWNAGDANNGITFYNGTTSLGRFSTASLLTLLGQSTVTAIDGSVYQTANYFGKPGTGAAQNNRQDSSEPFGFLNFISQGTFTSVVFDNSNTTGTGFESDNHTIRATAPTASGTFVYVGQTNVPEPTSIGLLGVGGLIACVVRRKRLTTALAAENVR